MARVIILSRTFPAYHPKAGQPTYFVEALYKALFVMKVIPSELGDTYSYKMFNDGFAKQHTIRIGRRWKSGDKASLRCWSGKPYASKQIKLVESDVVISRVVDITIDYDLRSICVHKRTGYESHWSVNHSNYYINKLAANDGLTVSELIDWFQFGKKKGKVDAQILIWGSVSDY